MRPRILMTEQHLLLGAKPRGGSTPVLESDEIYSLTKLSILVFLPFCLPYGLSCVSILFIFSLFPFFSSFFILHLQFDTIYSPTPLTPPPGRLCLLLTKTN